MKQIKISIITVVYNAIGTVKKTIESVLNQKYPNIEYIVIDGASTDGTVEIIKKYEKQLAVWISEPDDGIYDAMNKGIKVATGDYVYFLGADDWLADGWCILRVVDYMNKEPDKDFYYGKVYLFNSTMKLKKIAGKRLTKDEIKHGMMCAHQSLFTRKKVMEGKFNTQWKIAADFEFFLRQVLAGSSFFYMNLDIAFFNVGGASSNIKIYKEYEEIMGQYLGEAFLYRIRKLRQYDERSTLKKNFKNLIKKIFGEKFYMKCRGWKDYDGNSWI